MGGKRSAEGKVDRRVANLCYRWVTSSQTVRYRRQSNRLEIRDKAPVFDSRARRGWRKKGQSRSFENVGG